MNGKNKIVKNIGVRSPHLTLAGKNSNLMKKILLLSLSLLIFCACTNGYKNTAQMNVDFEWQQID
jgi:hypothetical protein